MYTAEAEASETSIKDFCEKMALGSSYIEVSNELQDVIRHNEETQQKLGQLKERTGGQIHGQDLPHWDNEQLAEFYREVLFSHKIHSTQELNEFIERYGNSILKLNDISLLIPEYDKIIKQYPDTIQHPNGHIYEVRYGSNHPMVVIPLNDIEIIRDTDFNHYFEGKIYDFYVNAYAVRSIENYAKENQERLKEMKWEDFQITHPVSEDISFDAWDETYIPNEVVYDQATQAVAYECLTTEYM